MKLELILKHGRTDKQDVKLEISDDSMTLVEPDIQREYSPDIVELDGWQIRKLYEVLSLWIGENDL